MGILFRKRTGLAAWEGRWACERWSLEATGRGLVSAWEAETWEGQRAKEGTRERSEGRRANMPGLGAQVLKKGKKCLVA